MYFPKILRLVFLTFSFSLILSSCGNKNQDEKTQTELPASITNTYAVVATGMSEYGGAGAHSILSYSAPRSTVNNLLPTGNDLKMSSYEEHFYRIERSTSSSVTKFSIDDPSTPIWNFSTEGTETNSNPSQMIFVNETKAYLLRYNSTKAWIVNPSVTKEQESEFKTSELDLSAYDDGDGAPEMASGVIVGNKLFIALQRYSMIPPYGPNNDSYIAVFDTNTNAEVDTTSTGVGLKGIKLDVRNPAGKIKYHDGYIYVAGADNYYYGGTTYGGIQRINTTTYIAEPIMIGTTNTDITNVEIISPTKGYFVQYNAWGDNSFKSFNPQTGIVSPGNVAGIGDNGDRNLQDIIVDHDGLLWVSDGSITNPGVYIIDTATDTIQEGPISTNLNPLEITFCEK